MAAYNKSGVVRYYVTTDTHGYPWGFRNGVDGTTVHFDLGDNTAGWVAGDFDIPETMSVEANIALRGNHDTATMGWNKNSRDENGAYRLKLQIYEDSAKEIIVFGLDSGNDDLNLMEIPDRQINEMAQRMSTLGENWDVIVLTHQPLFPGVIPEKGWNLNPCWSKNESSLNNTVRNLFTLLQAFRRHQSYTAPNGTTYNFSFSNGHVIGCFAGHIHNHVKCVYKGFPMEAFPTNGSDEWTVDPNRQGGYSNMGLYIPALSYINVNFDYNTVNGTRFDIVGQSDENEIEEIIKPSTYYHDEDECYYIDKAAGYFKMQPNTTAHPKFYNGTYIGYTYSPLDGTVFGRNGHTDRFWPFGTTVTLRIGSSNVSARVLWFDTNGRLRYYSNKTDFNDTDKSYSKKSQYTEITNYKSARVTFTANNIQWVFQNGLLVSATPFFRSGRLNGKHKWNIRFNSSGVPEGIYLEDVKKTYGAGDNYINVSEIKIYDGTTLKTISTMPQIGITGTFNSTSKINLARADYSGSNQISDPDKLLVRVVGDDGAVLWLYDGKLTTLTDQQVL